MTTTAGTASGQLHLTHRSEYLRGRTDGRRDATAGDYRPCRHDGSDSQRAYSQGYSDGYADAHPCELGTCDHLAHRATS